jgi:hypothetical protein
VWGFIGIAPTHIKHERKNPIAKQNLSVQCSVVVLCSVYQHGGFDMPLFARSLFVNGAAAGFSVDMLVSLLIFWFWSYRNAREHNVTLW